MNMTCDLYRNSGEPWGFRLQGGSDYRAQLGVKKVTSHLHGSLHTVVFSHSVRSLFLLNISTAEWKSCVLAAVKFWHFLCSKLSSRNSLMQRKDSAQKYIKQCIHKPTSNLLWCQILSMSNMVHRPSSRSDMVLLYSGMQPNMWFVSSLLICDIINHFNIQFNAGSSCCCFGF